MSSSASAQTVTVSDPAPVDVETTTSLSVPATAITGTAVDLTATVAPNNAVGTVQFKSNGTAIGSPVTVSGRVLRRCRIPSMLLVLRVLPLTSLLVLGLSVRRRRLRR